MIIKRNTNYLCRAVVRTGAIAPINFEKGLIAPVDLRENCQTFYCSRAKVIGPQNFFVKPGRRNVDKFDKFLRVITLGEGLWTFWPRLASKPMNVKFTFLN